MNDKPKFGWPGTRTKYAYDSLDRLTSATSSAITEGFTYDANGNRLTETGNFYPGTLSISPTNNQITQTTGALPGTFTYDAAGNSTSFGSDGYGDSGTYNARGRMSIFTYPGGYTENLAYDAFGRLILASGVAADEILIYDQANHLLGEYDLSGNLIQETVWLGDIPVATLRPNGSGGIDIYDVHTDHLTTTRTVTRPSDNEIVWQWDSDPFGVSAPNENPAGLGSFLYNLRFPGQALFFNGARVYDAPIGRYDESDPIGLNGGSYSPYVYVNNDPLRLADPSGLVQWHGEERSYGASAGVGAAIHLFTLSSDCESGRAAWAKVVAVGPSVGADIEGLPPFNTTFDEVDLHDQTSIPDPNILDGKFLSISVGGVLGTGAHAPR